MIWRVPGRQQNASYNKCYLPVQHSITTSTYHILTPYPGTQLFTNMENEGRILHRNWDQYDTRHVVYQTSRFSAEELKAGYDWSYKEFYSWKNIFASSFGHDPVKHIAKHFFYAGGWRKFEAVWNFLIKTRHLNDMLPMLESILSKVQPKKTSKTTLPGFSPNI